MKSSSDRMASYLVLTADSPNFDQVTVRNWEDEGYKISYLPYLGNKKEYLEQLENFAQLLPSEEHYAVVGMLSLHPRQINLLHEFIYNQILAYGDAAEIVLEKCTQPVNSLKTIIAYYPTAIPHLDTAFPTNLNMLVHLAGSDTADSRYKSYAYPYAEKGFAEVGLGTYDKVSASLAWSRTLAVVRKGFGIEVDLEKVWEEHIERRCSYIILLSSFGTKFDIALSPVEFLTKDVDRTMATMVPEPYVNHIPTLTGGIGYKDLYRFYHDFFIPCNPPSMGMRLLSRTVGTDRVVDEMHVQFLHTQEIPWMLPGVAPTGKEVKVALVSVVCIRGGKLYHEHIYW